LKQKYRNYSAVLDDTELIFCALNKMNKTSGTTSGFLIKNQQPLDLVLWKFKLKVIFFGRT